MIDKKIILILLFISLLIGSLGGAWIGYKVASGDCAIAEKTRIASVLEKTSDVLNESRKDVDVQEKTTQMIMKTEAKITEQQTKDSMVYEKKIEANVDCSMSDDNYSLLINTIRRSNSRKSGDNTNDVYDDVSENTRTNREQ